MAKRKYVKSTLQISRETGEAESTIGKWLREGMPADGAARDRWIADRKSRQDQQGQSRELKDALMAAQALKIQCQAQLAEIELASRKGQLVERDEVDRVISQFLSEARQILQTLPDLVIAYMPSDSPRETTELCRQNCIQVVNGALKTLARMTHATTEVANRKH